MSSRVASLVIVAALAQSGSYRAEIEAFRHKRAADISAETGWAALTDLRWLEAGQFTVGRGKENRIALSAPSSPDRIGVLTIAGEVTLRVAPGTAAAVRGQAITQTVMKPDAPIADAVTIGGLTLGVIERGGKLALRVWDRASPDRVHFAGLKWYDVDEKWRIEAKWQPHAPVPTFHIQNIVGQIVDMPNPGAAVFTVGAKTYRLEALLEEAGDQELFFMFRDATSNTTTYGAGRYLYTPMPKDGRLTLDFNRAYNPPCAFTKFATCPLPPPANRLPIAVTAGELAYRH